MVLKQTKKEDQNKYRNGLPSELKEQMTQLYNA